MKRKLNKQQLLQLIKGASLFTTGGGLSFDEQKKSVTKLSALNLELLSLTDLKPNDYIVTAGEVGPADAPPIDKKKIGKKMVAMLEKNTDKKIAAIYFPEIGQESIVMEAAYYASLPVVDFDPVGFRAVPFLDINVFNLKRIPFSLTPMVAANDVGELFYIEGNMDYDRAEKVVREMTSLSKTGIVFLMSGLVQVDTIKKYKLSTGSITKSYEYGQLSKLGELIAGLRPLQTLSMTVEKRVEKEQKGFLFIVLHLVDHQNKKYKLVVLNEALFLLDATNSVVHAVPQRMLLIDSKRLSGIGSGDLKEGKSFTLAILKPQPEWQGKRAEKIFGKERFNHLLKEI